MGRRRQLPKGLRSSLKDLAVGVRKRDGMISERLDRAEAAILEKGAWSRVCGMRVRSRRSILERKARFRSNPRH